MSDEYFESEAEKLFVKFDDERLQIGPKSRNWTDRVKLEMKNVSVYINYLQDQKNALWFRLAPSRDKKYNYRVWEGFLKIPGRDDIRFDMAIVLTSDYPKVFPRCFVEEKIIDYAAGNLYIENKWQMNGKTYVMLCHDHMKDLNVWSPNLSIAHFLLQEILVWWNSKMNVVLKMWDGILG
ncbi:MAG: hypothetical protein INQ03_11010 [Candidatus Heimdallarchaeota archaeon]|nr:hypothetical protein [Candidatus Heimdallarchaeota archaeon]